MPNRKIKVLEIVPALNVDNGVASFSMNYFRKLDHSKYTVDFALFKLLDSPYFEEIQNHGGKIYLLPAITSPVKHIKECNKILKLGQYDIIHNNALSKSLPMMWCAKKLRIPVRILHSHNSSLGDNKRKTFRNKIVLSIIKKLSTNYLACSEKAGKCYFGTQPFLLVPNVIDGTKFRFDSTEREKIRAEMGVDNKTVICTVGRFAIQKNPFFALDVIKALSQKHEDLEYWWVGTGAIESDVRNYSHQQGLDSIVSFLGARKDMVELYQATDIFFLPSLFEGLPVTGVESQAMGLPAVISNTVTKEMVYTDLVEFVPLDASIDAWVKAIEKQMVRIPARRSYTKELENSVFSIEQAGSSLERLYQEMLGQAGL